MGGFSGGRIGVLWTAKGYGGKLMVVAETLAELLVVTQGWGGGRVRVVGRGCGDEVGGGVWAGLRW